MKPRPRVVVTDAGFDDVAPEAAAAAAAGAEFARFAARSAEAVAEAVAGATVAVVQFAPFTAAAAAAMAGGGTVIRYGVGYNNLDLDAIRARGLRAAYVPDYCTDEVADHTAAMALALLRRITALDASLRRGEWAVQKVAAPMPPLSETVVGFLGYGRIARAVASRLRGFGVTVIAHDPFHVPSADDPPAEMVGIEGLFARADCLSLHAPSTPETVGIVNAATLAAMKPTACIVNTARGDLIDEAALAEALAASRLAGAALDVFAEEPLPEGSALRRAPNLILSPHAAWYSDVAVRRLQHLVADEIARALEGRPVRRPIPGTGV